MPVIRAVAQQLLGHAMRFVANKEKI